MTEQSVIEVSDILDSFDMDEISNLIKSQINTDSEDDTSTDILTDLFQPLYAKYRAYMDMEIPNDIKEQADDRFTSICDLFLDAIENKFGVTLEEDWKDGHKADLPGVTTALYSLFVTDFYGNLYEIFVNYIVRNIKLINEVFDAMKVKKDAASNTYRKDFHPEVALVASNIFDITIWILEQIDEEDFFEYIDEAYIPSMIVQRYYNDGIINGDFMGLVNDIYTKSSSLQSKICLDIISNLLNGAIFGDYKPVSDDE